MSYEAHIDHDRIAAPAPISALASASRPAPRVRQPWGRLLKAVLDLAGEHAELVCHAERDWASATFSGSRHAITLRFSGHEAAQAGEGFIVALPDHDFVIPRYLVADAQITRIDDRQLPERELAVEVDLLLLDRA